MLWVAGCSALQMNSFGFGLTSSGYSSKTAHPLPAAQRFKHLVEPFDIPSEAFYSALSGCVTPEQTTSRGMREDSVHMFGPEELIRGDLADFLPRHMRPRTIALTRSLPTTPNGKVDIRAVEADYFRHRAERKNRPAVQPRTPQETLVAGLWKSVPGCEVVSVIDNFFDIGGNSITAVRLTRAINDETGAALPLQAIFQAPTIQDLAALLSGKQEDNHNLSRLVPFSTPAGQERPVYCWPGLGGYPMNLRPLARATNPERPFYGVQAAGMNDNEQSFSSVYEMAQADAALILKQPIRGPYTLWGYSFGARVAYQTAHLLEAAGHHVDRLVLIAPGSPIQAGGEELSGRLADYTDSRFVRLLYSVFGQSLTNRAADRCAATVSSREEFVAFIAKEIPGLDSATVQHICDIVEKCHSSKYTFEEMLTNPVKAPITILKMRGDDYSFIERSATTLTTFPEVHELDIDHYEASSTTRPPGRNAHQRDAEGGQRCRTLRSTTSPSTSHRPTTPIWQTVYRRL